MRDIESQYLKRSDNGLDTERDEVAPEPKTRRKKEKAPHRLQPDVDGELFEGLSDLGITSDEGRIFPYPGTRTAQEQRPGPTTHEENKRARRIKVNEWRQDIDTESMASYATNSHQIGSRERRRAGMSFKQVAPFIEPNNHLLGNDSATGRLHEFPGPLHRLKASDSGEGFRARYEYRGMLYDTYVPRRTS